MADGDNRPGLSHRGTLPVPTCPAHLRFPTRPCSSRCNRALSRRRLSSLVNVPSECLAALERGEGGEAASWSRARGARGARGGRDGRGSPAE